MNTRDARHAGDLRAKPSGARDAALVFLIAAGLACSFLLSRNLDARRPAEDPFASYEELYVSPAATRRMSLAFNGLAADWYWLRSLQYLGRKAGAFEGEYTLDDLGPLRVGGLVPMLKRVTALDPQFMAAYEFGAVVLPTVDETEAVRFIERGILENPHSWRLRQHLGYIHWQAGRFTEAAAAYRAGAELEGAPGWMDAMAAQMEESGGSRDTARQLYRRMIESADEEQIKLLAAKRLLQLQSLDERDAIRRALRDFQTRASRCPSNWRELAPALRALRLKTDAGGAPLDPTDAPYRLDPAACDVTLDGRSAIPKK